MNILTKLIMIVTSFITLGACSSTEYTLADIEGTWEVISFKSGGSKQKPTTPTFFIFTKEMRFIQQSELLSFDEEFKLQGNMITIELPSGDLNYHKILALKGDEMKLENKAVMGSTIYYLKRTQ